MKLQYRNGNNNVYQIAGRQIAIPATLSPEQAKAEIAHRFSLSVHQIDQLSQVQTTIENLDLHEIDELTDTANPAQLIAALKQMRQLIGEMQAVLRFQMLEEPPQIPGT